MFVSFFYLLMIFLFRFVSVVFRFASLRFTSFRFCLFRSISFLFRFLFYNHQTKAVLHICLVQQNVIPVHISPVL